jgi:hypothetical protein
MHAIISQRGQMINLSSISNLLLVLSAWGTAFLVSLWLSLIFWTYRDIQKRSTDRILRLLSVMSVAALFLPGVIIYIILRPQFTLEEEYQQTLEEESLLHAIESSHRCPGCSRQTKEDWVVCPSCHTFLKKSCNTCNKQMDLHWNVCAYCGTPVEGMRTEKTEENDLFQPSSIIEDTD